MRVQVTLDFLPPTGGMTPAAFLKWLTGNLEDHFRDEHEWDQEICPELAAVHAVIEAFSNEPRLEVEEPRDEES